MIKGKNRYTEFKKRVLARPKVKESFEEGLDVLRLAVSMEELREKRGLTQTKLAAHLQTSQAVISRIENGENVELKTLQRIAQSLHARLKIELVEALLSHFQGREAKTSLPWHLRSYGATHFSSLPKKKREKRRQLSRIFIFP